MTREEILKEIARLDEEINRTVAAVELPKLEHRPFPLGMWFLTAGCFAWYRYGGQIPQAYIMHYETAMYAYYLGIIFGVIAVLATISWIVRGRGYSSKSEAYTAAGRSARELQERRRDLQAELRAISRD